MDVFDIDGASGHFAMYEEPPSGPTDAPLTDPLAHLDRITLHSALAYLQVATEIDITINHARVPKPTTGWSWSSWSFNWVPNRYTLDRLLGTHGLGVVPIVIVATGSGLHEPTIPVQTNSAGGVRYVDIYLTATQVRAYERVDSANAALPAISRNYKLIVLSEPTITDEDMVFDADSGRVRAGGGMFDSDFHYLRAVDSGESPYFMTAGQNIDTDGGICRTIDANGTIRHDFFQASDYKGSLNSLARRQVQR